MATVTKMASQHFLRWQALSGVIWVSVVLTLTFLMRRAIPSAGDGKAWQDEIILVLASCLLIVAGLMAGNIKKLFE